MKLEPHPMAGASLIEVMDYLALRLAEVRDVNADDRNLRNASDRYDEAYMWVVAWVSSQAAVAAPAVDAVPAGEVEPQLNRHDLYRFMDTLKLSEKREVAKAIRFVPAPLTGETDMQRWSRMLAWAAENGKKTELAIAIRAALSHGEGRK